MKDFVKSEKRLLGDFARKIWLPHLKDNKTSSRLEEVTLRLYISPFFDDTPLVRITSDKINQWLDWLRRRNFSPASRNRYLLILRNIFNFANDLGVIRKMPFDGVKAEKIKRRKPSAIAPELFSDLILFLEKEDTPGHRALLLIMRTGLKKGEILKLRREYVDLAENLLLLPNCKPIPLSPESLAVLEKQLNESKSEWVFPNISGKKPITDIYAQWNIIRNKLGFENIRICDLNALYKTWKENAADAAVLEKYALKHEPTLSVSV